MRPQEAALGAALVANWREEHLLLGAAALPTLIIIALGKKSTELLSCAIGLSRQFHRGVNDRILAVGLRTMELAVGSLCPPEMIVISDWR